MTDKEFQRVLDDLQRTRRWAYRATVIVTFAAVMMGVLLGRLLLDWLT